MQDIKNFLLESIENINEFNNIHSKWKSLVKKLSVEDKNFIKSIAINEKNNIAYSMEEIEQRCWKGDLKDKWEEMYEKLEDDILNVENGILPSDIVNTYSLARSGKQAKIEVFAQAAYMININL